MRDLSFRQFLELVQDKPGYVDALAQLGVRPEDAVATPQWLGNGTIHQNTYSGVTFEVVRLLKNGKGETTGAVIRMGEAQPQGVTRKDSQGRQVDLPNYKPGDTMTVDVKTLNSLLYPPALAAMPAAGGAGGAPGAPPGSLGAPPAGGI